MRTSFGLATGPHAELDDRLSALATMRHDCFRRLFGIVAARVPQATVAATAAAPLPVECRCGREIVPADGARVDGWTHAATGRAPGKAGGPGWLRIDIANIAPRVLALGGGGYKHVRMFDAGAKPLVDALVQASIDMSPRGVDA